MKRFLITALMAIAPTTVFAQSIVPNEPFQGDGVFSVTVGGVNLPCQIHVVGAVSNGTGRVTTATLAGPNGCPLYLVGTPWILTPISATQIKVSGFTARTPLADCAPSVDIIADFNNATHQLRATQSPVGRCRINLLINFHDAALTIQ